MKVSMEHGRKGFYQWDTGQRLIVEDDGDCREVHFAHSCADLALVCTIREENGVRVVDVPNILLQEAGKLWAYLYHYAQDGALTRHANCFDVSARPKPDSYVYTETETMNYTYLDERIKAMEATGADPEAIASGVEKYLSENPITPEGIGALPAEALPEAVNDALAQAKESGEFDGADGYTPVKGVDYFTDADKQEIAQQAAGLVEIPSGGSSEWTLLHEVTLEDHVGSVSYTPTGDYTEFFALAHAQCWVVADDAAYSGGTTFSQGTLLAGGVYVNGLPYGGTLGMVYYGGLIKKYGDHYFIHAVASNQNAASMGGFNILNNMQKEIGDSTVGSIKFNASNNINSQHFAAGSTFKIWGR